MDQLFVGIDVGSRGNVAYIMRPDGELFSTFAIGNTLGGYRDVSKRIVAAMDKLGLGVVQIGMEATSIYGDGLVHAIREDGSLGRFQRKIHVLNPKQVSKFKESYNDLPKTDWVDASYNKIQGLFRVCPCTHRRNVFNRL